MNVVVRCHHCDGLSRVPESAVAHTVQCPLCARTFTANPEGSAPTVRSAKPVPRPIARPAKAPIPTVYPARLLGASGQLRTPTDADLHDPDAPKTGPTSVLIGLALLPFGIPLFWLLAPILTGKETIFSFGLPIAIAVGISGVCLGVVFTRDWSFSTKLKGTAALLLVAYFVAGFLYFLKTEWVIALRKDLMGNTSQWISFSGEQKAYTVMMPSYPQPDREELLAGWPLQLYRAADRSAHSETYIVGHGEALATARGQPDDAFFASAKQSVVATTKGTLDTDKPIMQQGYDGREFVFTLADRASTRTVRIYRVGEQAFVVAIEGAFLPADSTELKKFFGSFHISALRK